MTSSIYTLVPDIQALLRRKDGWLTPGIADEFANVASMSLQRQFSSEYTPRLRLSQMGPRCPRALWYSIHHPELAEKMPAWAENKFAFGHIIEAWAIALAKAAGHEVTGEQDELVVDGIVGHRDCVIDGCVLDVKSVTSRGISKYEDGTLWKDDMFGYLEQLDGYICGSLEDPLVRVKDKGYILAIDKQLGHMALYEHKSDNDRQRRLRDRISAFREYISRNVPPPCECGTEPYGKSGNIGLDTKASYNSYKYCCFPHLRTFIYANGPVYLTKVVRRPEDHIIEVDRHGQPVPAYH